MTNSIIMNATGWAEFLVNRSFKGAGDTVEAAIDRAARKHKISRQTLWALRYKPPKRIWADIYLSLQEAYDDETQRQEARVRHELETLRRVLGDAATNNPVVLAAESALRAMEKEREG